MEQSAVRYQWATRLPIVYQRYKKIAVKTNTASWFEKPAPAIILFSVHSAFHENEKGFLNVKALTSTIKKQTKSPLTVLLADAAHLNVFALKHDCDYEKALTIARQDAKTLMRKFSEAFEGCDVVLWGDFVHQDPDYPLYAKQVMDFFDKNIEFRTLVIKDAEATYTLGRVEEFLDKKAYLDSTIKDLLEQCVYTLIAAKNEYRFEFYPGKQYDSIYFINSALLMREQQITHVHVNITFEKR